ncbi:MAG: hypothetical protein E7434_08995 [Ruminococcaceae bacterium]|nr:hypothetical protein [Oscillospiraceae bacterium]
MKILFVGFKGKNNTSAQLATQLGGHTLLLTNSCLRLEKDILSVTESYDSIIMFGVDNSLNATLRIEKCAELYGIAVSSDYDVAQLSKIMDGYGIANSISNVPTQYLCNAAYYHMLCINKNVVFIHIPSIKGMNDTFMGRLQKLFRKLSQDA